MNACASPGSLADFGIAQLSTYWKAPSDGTTNAISGSSRCPFANIPLQPCASAVSPWVSEVTGSSLSNLATFCFAVLTRSRAASISVFSRVFGEYPRARSAAPSTSRRSSRRLTLPIWPLHARSKNSFHDRGGDGTFEVFQPMPVTPHRNGTDHSPFGSYAGFLYA